MLELIIIIFTIIFQVKDMYSSDIFTKSYSFKIFEYVKAVIHICHTYICQAFSHIFVSAAPPN